MALTYTKLPPVDKRRMNERMAHIFIAPYFYKHKDDTYIYYKTFIYGLWVGAFFSCLNIVSHFGDQKIDLGLFVIDVSGANFVEKFIYSYPFYVPPFLLLLLLIYTLPVFLNNIDFKKYDLLWWESKWPIKRRKKERSKLLRLYLARSVLTLICLSMSFTAPRYVIKVYPLEESYSFLFILLIVFTYYLSAFSMFLFLFSAGLIQIYTGLDKSEADPSSPPTPIEVNENANDND